MNFRLTEKQAQGHTTNKKWSESVLVTRSCPTLWGPMDYSLPGSSVQARITGVDSHFLLQKIFLTQRWNLGLLHCRQILYCLSHQGSPINSKTRIQTQAYPMCKLRYPLHAGPLGNLIMPYRMPDSFPDTKPLEISSTFWQPCPHQSCLSLPLIFCWKPGTTTSQKG